MFQAFFDKKVIVLVVLIFSGCTRSIEIVSNQEDSTLQKVALGQKQSPLKISTQDLLNGNALLKSDPTNKSYADEIKSQAQKRLKLIQEALEKDPSSIHSILSEIAFSKKVRESFPESAKEFIEKDVQRVQGTLKVLEVDGEKSSETQYFLFTETGKKMRLYLNSKGLQSESKVEIPSAIEIPGSGETSYLVSANVSGSPEMLVNYVPRMRTTGTFKTLYVLARFQDETQPFTIEDVKTSAQKVADYYYESSFRHTTKPFTVVGPYVIPVNRESGGYMTDFMMFLPTALDPMVKASGVDPSQFDHVLYITPHIGPLGGLAFGPVISWVGKIGFSTMVHETGHNLGLTHSHALRCDGGTFAGNCSTQDYGDFTDPMGNSTGHFGAANKEYLGWLNQSGFPSITSVQSSGQYQIEPYSTYSTNPKAIKIAKAADSGWGSYYFLEYRQPIGLDSTIKDYWGQTATNIYQGLLLKIGNSPAYGLSYLLNANPPDYTYRSVAITSALTFTDPNAPGGGVTVSLVSASSTGATVSVKFGGSQPTCIRAKPSWSVVPGAVQWVSPGEGRSFTLYLKNNDTSACSESTYAINATLPAGVSGSLSASTLTVAPGDTKEIALQVQSSTSSPSGTYTVITLATNTSDSSLTASASPTLGVQSECVRVAPSMVVSPTSKSTRPGKSVSYSVSITNKDKGSCTANKVDLSASAPSPVSVRMNPASLLLAPGQTLSATLEASVPQGNSSVGSYNLSVSASSNLQSGQGSVSLMVNKNGR